LEQPPRRCITVWRWKQGVVAERKGICTDPIGENPGRGEENEEDEENLFY
jgi:hypothetical protein